MFRIFLSPSLACPSVVDQVSRRSISLPRLFLRARRHARLFRRGTQAYVVRLLYDWASGILPFYWRRVTSRNVSQMDRQQQRSHPQNQPSAPPAEPQQMPTPTSENHAATSDGTASSQVITTTSPSTASFVSSCDRSTTSSGSCSVAIIVGAVLCMWVVAGSVTL